MASVNGLGDGAGDGLRVFTGLVGAGEAVAGGGALGEDDQPGAGRCRFGDILADPFEILRDVGQCDVHLDSGDAHRWGLGNREWGMVMRQPILIDRRDGGNRAEA